MTSSRKPHLCSRQSCVRWKTPVPKLKKPVGRVVLSNQWPSLVLCAPTHTIWWSLSSLQHSKRRSTQVPRFKSISNSQSIMRNIMLLLYRAAQKYTSNHLALVRHQSRRRAMLKNWGSCWNRQRIQTLPPTSRKWRKSKRNLTSMTTIVRSLGCSRRHLFWVSTVGATRHLTRLPRQ